MDSPPTTALFLPFPPSLTSFTFPVHFSVGNSTAGMKSSFSVALNKGRGIRPLFRCFLWVFLDYGLHGKSGVLLLLKEGEQLLHSGSYVAIGDLVHEVGIAGALTNLSKLLGELLLNVL